MSCSELADQVGIHEQSLRNLELYDSVTRPADPKGCSWEVLERIAAALGVRVQSISRGPIGQMASPVPAKDEEDAA
nr:helix-turn-helix transcriptional regulator [Nocardiopsis sp. MT53]